MNYRLEFSTDESIREELITKRSGKKEVVCSTYEAFSGGWYSKLFISDGKRTLPSCAPGAGPRPIPPHPSDFAVCDSRWGNSARVLSLQAFGSPCLVIAPDPDPLTVKFRQLESCLCPVIPDSVERLIEVIIGPGAADPHA